MVRRVAVVGAGSSGLACVKMCVDEGLEPVCFESTDDIGGMWKFKVSFPGDPTEWTFWIKLWNNLSFHLQETVEPDQGSIYRSLVTNTSKEIMSFSDFPMPADYPNYLHNTELVQYFRLYAEHFHLHRYIRFQVTFIDISGVSAPCWHAIKVNAYAHVCISLVLDQSEESHTEARFLCLRSMGHCDNKQGRRGRETHFWCSAGLFRPVCQSSNAPVRLSRYAHKMVICRFQLVSTCFHKK